MKNKQHNNINIRQIAFCIISIHFFIEIASVIAGIVLCCTNYENDFSAFVLSLFFWVPEASMLLCIALLFLIEAKNHDS